MRLELVFLLCCLLSWSLAQEDPGEEPPTRPPFVPPPRPSGDVYFAESFSDGEDAIWKRWVMSEATKDGADDDVAKYNGMVEACCCCCFLLLFFKFCFPFVCVAREMGAGGVIY